METEDPVQKPKSKKRIAIILIVLVLGLVGLGVLFGPLSSDDLPAEKPEETAATTDVSKINLYQERVVIGARYIEPIAVNIKVGDSVAWVNKDRGTHIITSDTGPVSFKGQGALSFNDMYLVTFKTAGTYTYHNASNIGSKGTIIVK